MLPILDDAKDERFEGVILIEDHGDEKTTAEDCGEYWYVRSWEIGSFDGEKYWFNRSGYSISKTVIEMLVKNGMVTQ